MMREVDYKKLGQRIRERRLTLGMTQQQIAEAIGLEPSNISHIERGAIKTTLAPLVAIANQLETTPDLLLYDSLDYTHDLHLGELSRSIQGCSPEQLRIIAAVVKTLKTALEE